MYIFIIQDLIYKQHSDNNILYNDNVIKFNTTSTGVTVHGTTDPILTIRQGGSSSSGSGFLAYENVDGNGTPRSIAKIQGKTAGNGGYGDIISRRLSIRSKYDSDLVLKSIGIISDYQ